jgi:hypothetical protein
MNASDLEYTASFMIQTTINYTKSPVYLGRNSRHATIAVVAFVLYSNEALSTLIRMNTSRSRLTVGLNSTLPAEPESTAPTPEHERKTNRCLVRNS